MEFGKDSSVPDKLKVLNKHMNYQPVRVSAEAEIPMSALSIAEILGLQAEIVEKASEELGIRSEG